MTYSTLNPPAGSFALSVKNIELVLVAQAQKISGEWVEARLVLPNDATYELENLDGILHVHRSGNGSDGPVPIGSYLRTCRDVRVLLYCDAQKLDGSYAKSVLDITDIKNPDIGNYDGLLLDKPAVDAAINQLAAIAPEDAGHVAKDTLVIQQYMQTGVQPSRSSASAPSQSSQISGMPSVAPANLMLSPCALSCAALAFDLLMSLLAYRGMRREQILIALRDTDSDLYRYLLRNSLQAPIVTLVEELDSNGSVGDIAWALANAMTSLMSPALLSAMIKAMYKNLSWWDATKMSVAFIATTTALFTPGAEIALVAKCVLFAMSVETLAEDIYHVTNDCVLS